MKPILVIEGSLNQNLESEGKGPNRNSEGYKKK